MKTNSIANLCMIVFTISSSTLFAESLLVEAEQFEDRGGWVVDTQFIDQMGSPYLLAHGLGKPVKNACTRVQIPVTGQYQVWVRTKNWVPGPWEAPGRFKLIIDRIEHRTIFGTENGWQWQKGNSVDLKQGQVLIELQDITGFNARCDAVFLTTDKNLIPDNSSVPLNPWRREQLGIRVYPSQKNYDLVVVGGGLAGMGAALSGARMGLTVALLENRSVLGGNGSSEIRVAPRGNMPGWLYPFGDMVQEFSPYTPTNAGLSEQYFDEIREQVIRAEKRIDLFLNHHVFAAETQDNRITSISTMATRENAIRHFKGAYFVDATGHGVLGLMAKADYHMEEKDRMGMSNLWRWRFTSDNQPFPDLPWALPLTEKGFPYPDQKGDWFWESGFDRHPLNDLEAIRDHNLRAIYGAWNAIKNKHVYANHDKSGKSHAAAELEWIAYTGGTRETLQLLGDVILSKDDIVANRQFPDACVIVTWGLDLHYPHPLYQPESQGNPFISRAHFGGRVHDTEGPLARQETHYVTSEQGHGFDRTKGYAIPYRCLYSRNIENLFMPGRNMSVTHEALGTIRVMQTLGMAGVAVGRAAWLAKKYDVTPREVYEHHLEELKKVWELPAKYRNQDAAAYRPAFSRTEAVKTWESLRFGAFVHFNDNTFIEKEISQNSDPSLFNPRTLDFDGMMAVFKKAGIRYAVLTARHTSGFCLWDSSMTEFDVANSPFQKDVVALFVEACRKYDTKPCLYYCLWGGDWRPWEWNRQIRKEHEKASPNDVILTQLGELAEHYGDIYAFWLDMYCWADQSLKPQVLYDLLKTKNQGTFVHFNQHVQDGSQIKYFPTDFVNGEERIPPEGGHQPLRMIDGKTYYLPFEYEITSQRCDSRSLGNGLMPGSCWFTHSDSQFYQVESLFDYIKQSFERGGSNVLLSTAPDKTGVYKSEDAECLLRLGKMIQDWNMGISGKKGNAGPESQ